MIEPADEMPFVRRLFAKVFRPSIRQGVVVLFDQGFCSIANFLTGVLVARACSKAEYGLYVLGFTLLMTAMGIQASLSGTPFTVLSPPLKGKDRQFYLGSTLVQHLVVSAIAAFAFVVGAAVLFAAGRIDRFARVLFALGVVSVFVLLRDFMRYVLLAQLRVWASLLMGLVANVAIVFMLCWAYVGGWLTAPVAYLILGGCSGLPVLFVLLRERNRIKFATNKLREHLKENYKFGKWLIAQTVAFFFAVQIYPWALMAFKGAPAAGVYGVCLGLAAVLNPLFMGLNRFIGPKTAHAANQGVIQVHRVVYMSMLVICGFFLPFLVGTLFFGERAIVSLYGQKYMGIGGVFLIIMVQKTISGLASPISSGINALKRPDIGFVAQCLGGSVSILVGLPLAWAFGPLGAALGVCVASVFAVGYQLIRFHSLKIPIRQGQ